jgi:hypothetical protein
LAEALDGAFCLVVQKRYIVVKNIFSLMGMEKRKEEVTVYEKTVKVRLQKRRKQGREYHYGVIVVLLPKDAIGKTAVVKVYVLEEAAPAPQPQKEVAPSPLIPVDLFRLGEKPGFAKPGFTPPPLPPIEEIDLEKIFKKRKGVFGIEAEEGGD